MASVIVTTEAYIRVSYPHLAAPYAHQQGDDEKYRLQAMFSKSNEANIPEVGVIASHPFEIIDALNEVCLQEFNFPINDVTDVALLKEEVGVGFPPNFKDGDKVKKKDEKGRPIPGSFDENTAGYWLLNLSSFDPVAVIDHEEDEIDPKKVYAGCWVRIQVEVSAYYNNSNSAIVNIEPLAVQYVYDDQQLGGGRPPRPDVKHSFGKVEGGTANTRDAKRMGKPGERPTPQHPGQRPGNDSAPQRPNRPGNRPEPKSEPKRELRALTETSIEDCRNVYNMTDDEIVNEGYGEWVEVQEKPQRPNRPGQRPGNRPGGNAERPARPGNRSGNNAPAKRTPPPPKKQPAGPGVIMNEDSEFTYEELRDEHGFTDDDIVNSGYGQFDYTNVDQ